jgi:hypothetical protein|tara:strand:- start:798 stop:1031 length:234 start_codon:yes stop_codon:yes gene_type:complete
MARQSKIFEGIQLAIQNGKLKEPFSVRDINAFCDNLLAKSPSFLSKHCKDNPGGYKVYFVRSFEGRYCLFYPLKKRR